MKIIKKITYFFVSCLPILFIISLTVTTSCQIIKDITDNEIPTEEKPQDTEKIEEEINDISTDENDINYDVVYFEVGIDENSRHFESRVASVYRINPDGTNKEFIYTDINDEYGLAQVYSISPDGKKILCSISDDARGVYSALCYIDIATNNLVKLVEFDFSDSEEVSEVTYKEPIWSNSSNKIAYETISNPYTSNFRDGGIYIIDINTLDKQELVLDIKGASLRSTTFLYPVLFTPDDTKILATSHPYFPKLEGDEIIDFYTIDESLNVLDIGSGSVEEILNISQFEGIEARIISSFENFNILKDLNLIIFQVLGDFEEDGDLWICNINGENLLRLSNNNSLREQQPNVLDIDSADRKVAFVGVHRYGTISEQTKSGRIIIINLNDLQNLIISDLELEGTKPMFSPQGKYLAILSLNYNDNFTYIENGEIKIYKIESDESDIVVNSSNTIDLIGWIKG